MTLLYSIAESISSINFICESKLLKSCILNKLQNAHIKLAFEGKFYQG